MTKFTGLCIGGPLDGNMLTCKNSTYQVEIYEEHEPVSALTTELMTKIDVARYTFLRGFDFKLKGVIHAYDFFVLDDMPINRVFEQLTKTYRLAKQKEKN